MEPAYGREWILARVWRSYEVRVGLSCLDNKGSERTLSRELFMNPVTRSNAKSVTLGILSSQGVKLYTRERGSWSQYTPGLHDTVNLTLMRRCGKLVTLEQYSIKPMRETRNRFMSRRRVVQPLCDTYMLSLVITAFNIKILMAKRTERSRVRSI